MNVRTSFLQILTLALAFAPFAAYPVTPWQQGTLSGAVPPTLRNFQSVAGGAPFDGTSYVAALAGETCTTRRSQDGTDWRTYSEPDDSCTLRDLAWNGAEYLAVGSTVMGGMPSARTAWSGTAINFNYATPPSGANSVFHAVTPTPDGRYLIAGQSLLFPVLVTRVWFRTAGVGGAFSAPINLPTASAVNGLIWDGMRYMAVDEGGSLLVSDNGTAWISGAISPVSLRDIAVGTVAGVRTHVAVGDDGTIVTSINEGSSWTPYPHPIPYDFRAVAWNGERFVVVGTIFCGVLSSKDGIHWFTETSATCEPMNDIAWHSSMKRWMVVGENGVVLHNDSIFSSHFQN